MGKPKDKSAALNRQAILKQEEAADLFDGIDLPDIEKMRIALENPELILSSPEERISGTSLDDIELDPRLRDAQFEALRELEERGESGLTTEDRARYNILRRQSGADEKARQNSILQEMAQRGALDSGAQLAAQLSSSQSSAQREAEAADRLAADAASSRRQALQQAAQTAGNINAADYSRASNAASAKDQIAQFNAGVSTRDTQARRQDAANRSNIANQQEIHNRQLQQQQFQNQLSLTGARAGALTGSANLYSQQAARSQPTASTGSKVLSGAASGALLGAKIGSAGGPIGAGGGALLGAVGGFLADGGVKYMNGGVSASPSLGGYSGDVVSEEDLQEKLNEQVAIADEVDAEIAAEDSLDKDKISSGLGVLSKLVGSGSQRSAPSNTYSPIDTNYNTEVADVMNTKYSPVAYADGGYDKMGYEEGGVTEGRLVPGESYSGDLLPDRINSGESVHNLEMQQNLVEMLKELQERRVDDMVSEGLVAPNEDTQEEIIDVMRGDTPLEEADLDQNVVEPTEMGIKRLMELLENK